MAIDPKLIIVKPVNELPSKPVPSASDEFLLYDGTILKKSQWSNVLNQVVSGIKGVATLASSPSPWVSGDPFLYESWKVTQAGTYTNFKDSSNASIVVSAADLLNNLVTIDVTNRVAKKSIIPLPKGKDGIDGADGADGRSIETWTAKTYDSGSQVFHNNNIYTLEGTATAADVPGVASAWKVKIDMSNYVTKVNGKDLSTNDYTEVDRLKVNKIVTNGLGDKFLTDNGTYVEFEEDIPLPSGFYNVTHEVELPAGEFYNIASAVLAFSQDETTETLRKSGVIITFETSSGVWENYRFIGDSTNVADPAFWVLETDKDQFKGIIFNGQELIKDSAGKVALDINTDVEQTINPSSTSPVSSAAVAAEFSGLSSRYLAALQLNEMGEEDEKVYSISGLDEEGNVLSTTSEFSGGGSGGGETSTTKLILSKVSENPTVKQGDEVKLTYYYDHRDIATDTSTGLSGNATITVISGVTSQVLERTLTADSNNTIDVTNLLQVGTNTVRIRVEVDNGGSIQVTQVSWRVQVVTLRLTSSFDFAKVFNKGQNISVPFNLTGSGVKTLKLYVNGVHKEDRSITTSSSNGSFTVNTSDLSHGSASIQLVTELEVSASITLLSNSIYFDVAIQEPGNNTPIVATRFDYLDGTIIGPSQRPYISTRQFSNYEVRFAGYTPNSGQSLISVYSGNELLTSITSGFVQRNVTGRSTFPGNYEGRILVGNTTYTFGVVVNISDVDLSEPTDGLQVRLSALGRSNSDISRDSWIYEGVSTTFEDVQWAGDGWINNALRLMNGGKATINYKPLSSSSASSQPNSFAFTTKFKVSNAVDNTSPLISCMSGNVGFVITSEDARMVTGAGSEVSMKFAPDQEYNVAFVSMPVADPLTASAYEIANSGMLYLFINGILSGGVKRGAGDNIYQQGTPANIKFQGLNATLDVFNARAYNNYLTADQVLGLFMIDLNTVEEIIEKYEFNDVIDSEGDVTVESLPDGMRYVIVTGQQANGMSTVKYAAAMNDKDVRYNVDEILHIVKGGDPELNFKCVGGCIRLQGTSSLAYPIKNYRLYFRSAESSSVFGKVYLGVDTQGNGGVLIADAKPKFSFRLANAEGKRPAPVNVWCLKADFAESSSSHNTGMARMTNDTFVASGDPTPAQKHVDPDYQYDVRTAIDGEPCYYFYRNTVLDKPVFMGKFNFNNDKATEEVFGFLAIPGYHDAEWVDTKFGGKNPTECWEFLNNDYPMGSYLEDDFDAINDDGTPAWNRVFENRFPDNQDDYDDGTLPKPVFLERWVKWVKSTQGNPTKFKNELADYADVSHLCSYFVFTQLLGAVDQMVKNAMLAFWYEPEVDKMLAYYIFYDGDTILGVRNDGRLKYSWDLNRQTLDPELSASAGKNIYAYMGHGSVLWNNLEAQFENEIREAYLRLRSVLSNEAIYDYFNRDQSERFAERIYNLDAQYKYVEPATLGISVINNGVEVNTKYSFLESMQGSRMSHRKWWLDNRLDLFDAKYGTGQYQLTDINWKGTSDVGAKVTAVMSSDYFVEFKREGTTIDRKTVAKDATYEYVYGQTANIGTIFHLYGGKHFKTLDLSMWGGFTDLSLPLLANLENLILGKSSRQYTLSSLVIGNKMPKLKMIDVTNYNTLAALDLSNCYRLEQVKARGCSSMGTITLPVGAPLNSLILPSALTTLRLVGLPYLENSGIVFPDGNNVRNLIVDSSPNIDWEDLLDTLSGVENIRITGINMTGSSAFLDRFIEMGGIDSNGNLVENARLIGDYQFSTYVDEEIYDLYKSSFPELNIKQGEYSTLLIYEKNPTTNALVLDVKNVYNPANNTGYTTSNPYVASGHIIKILNKRHRYLGKQATSEVMTICQLHDKNSNFYADAEDTNLATPALLEGQEGDVWIKEPKYWYKGVNDHANGVIHVAYSSNEQKPSDPVGMRKVTKAEIIQGGKTIANTILRTGFSSFAASQLRNLEYSVIRFNVEGYKKAKITMAPYGTINNDYKDICGGMFLNASEGIVSSFRQSDTEFTVGTDFIIDIPEGSTEIAITLNNVFLASDYCFTLSKSDNLLDLGEWVESKEILTTPFETSIVGGKIRSIKTWQPYSAALAVSRVNVASRNFEFMSYDDKKNISNLALFKYGSRDIQRVVGGGAASYIDLGVSANYGMEDTEGQGTSYIPRFKSNPNISAPCVSLGYENLYNPINIELNPIGMDNYNFMRMLHPNDTFDKNDSTNFNPLRFYPERPEGNLIFSNGYEPNYNPTRLVWGKYLDLISISQVSGSDSTAYPDSVFLSADGRFISRNTAQSFASRMGFYYFDVMNRNDSTIAGFRIKFNKTIIETKNVNEFKQLIEVV